MREMRDAYLYSQGSLSDAAISKNRDSPTVHNATGLLDQDGIVREDESGVGRYIPLGLIQSVKTKVQKSRRGKSAMCVGQAGAVWGSPTEKDREKDRKPGKVKSWSLIRSRKKRERRRKIVESRKRAKAAGGLASRSSTRWHRWWDVNAPSNSAYSYYLIYYVTIAKSNLHPSMHPFATPDAT